MDRRGVIVAVGTLLAGCGGRGRRPATPTATRTPVPLNGPGARFSAALRSRGIAIEYLVVEDGSVNLDYRTVAASPTDLRREVAWVAGVFANVVQGGWRVQVLDATVLAGRDRLLATFRVERAWVEQYGQGEWATGSRRTGDRDAFRRRVLSTLEPPPSLSSPDGSPPRGQSGGTVRE